MASIMEKLDTLQKQSKVNQDHITSLREQLDVAADGGDLEEIAAIQAEIAARDGMVASFTRRIAKVQDELSESGRVKLKTENLKRAAIVQTELDAAAKVAIGIDQTLAQLVAQLEAVHAHGATARKEAAGLVRQMPAKERERQHFTLEAVGFGDTFLGALLEGELHRLGVFRDLAPLPHLRLSRHDLGTVAENVAKRAAKIPAAVATLAERVNEGL